MIDARMLTQMTEHELRQEFRRLWTARCVAATPLREKMYTRRIDAVLDKYNDEIRQVDTHD